MAKHNQVIRTDCRVFTLKWDGGILSPYVKKTITQLDLLKIIKALENVNNSTISDGLKQFIMMVDKKEGEEKGEEIKTDFSRKPPRCVNAIMPR